MSNNEIIETWGSITKEEKVKSLKHNALENTLVLENYEPFPGYFGKNLPTNSLPRSIFIITDKKYEAEDLAVILGRVSRKLQHSCYGTFGYVEIYNNRLYCLRIKNLDCFERIHLIQEYLNEEGVHFHKYQDINENAIIKIYKTFLLQKTEDYLYSDNFEENRIYIEYPFSVNWKEFREITERVKYNMSNNMFDAALGRIWRLKGLTNIIRIYDRNRNSLRMNMIRQLYIRETKSWLKENNIEPFTNLAGQRYYSG